MKKINVKSGAMAAVLAGTMALSMVPATAFAADATAGATVTQPGTAITKDWTVASEAQYDENQSFSFDLTYVGATNGGYSGNQVVKYDNKVPEQNKTLKTVTLKELSKKGDTLIYEKTLSQSDLFSGFTFETPGVYHFQLKENDVANKNVVKDSSVYDVYVNVAWKKNSVSEPEVQSVKFTKDNKTTKSESATFSNTAKSNHKLTVSKTVAGTAANTGDVFSFKLTVKNATGKYNVKKGNDTTQLTAGEAYDFTLKDGESIEVQNLPEGATYTVEETDAKGYDSTDVTDEDEATPENVVNNGDTKPTGKGIINTEDDTVAFTNNKGFAPETGITMNSLAGIAVATVAVAGGVTLVIRRRNRAGEDF